MAIDDAVSIEEISTDEKPFWEIGIHISDVSALISSNSNLDKEAKHIGESLYIGNTLVKPLFPADIYSGVCSLKEGEDRLAISLFIVMN
jgi:ribonuclease R